jgi:predicted subunit of tRNA(5-methylaminomethyl-2-thiouridylate) methyltransferase
MHLKYALIIIVLTVSTPLCAEVHTNKAEVLIDACKAGIEAKDPDRLMKLVHWHGVEENIKQLMRAGFADLVKRDIDGIKIVPLDESDIFEYERNGVKYATNLVPIGKLLILFEVTNPDESHAVNATFLVGEIEGKYIITTAAPVQ